MTTLRTIPATIAPARLTLAQSIGRRVALGALERLPIGRVTLVDGRERWSSRPDPRVAAPPLAPVEVRVLDPRFYSSAGLGGSLGVADAYAEGWWTTDDLPGVIETLTLNAEALETLDGPLAWPRRLAARAIHALRANTRAGARRNIRDHYDLSNEFFALFLDPSMTYSCALFEHEGQSLEAAQMAKIDRALDSLGLRPEHHLLEIGTGWGALAIRAATRVGCRVTTTTISDRQFDLASRRVLDAGVADRVTILRRDWRDLDGAFDRLVSIEMIEAVGRENVAPFLAACSRLLAPDGAAFIQAIVLQDRHFEAASRRADFLKARIFPGSCLLGVEFMLAALRRATDLRPLRIDEIGRHYVTTLAHWRARFLSRLPEVRALGFDDRFIRTWDYYFAYCQGVFASRRAGDAHLLLAKPLFREPTRAAPDAAGPRTHIAPEHLP